jgi:hypothetical protein
MQMEARVPFRHRVASSSPESLIFRQRPEFGRVIFIAAPHRGSDLARNWPGRIGSSVVKATATLLSVGKEALKLARGS